MEKIKNAPPITVVSAIGNDRLRALKWMEISNSLHQNGYALIPGFLPDDVCGELIRSYDQAGSYRKTVVMERHRFGLGEYKYFSYPLPEIVQIIRSALYPYLAPIANQWMSFLKLDKTFPEAHSQLLEECRRHNQLQPTPLILKYGTGGFNTLHQDLYGEVYFPMQCVLFLNQPYLDFTGGEFVLTQQTPRAQSKAMVLSPNRGDLLIFTTRFRPVQGSRGYYRANMKHGVSEVRSGARHTLGIIFHDAVG
jgi:hypothetical protein